MPRREAARKRTVIDQALEQIETRGLTAYEVGAGSGVDRSCVHRWMRGERGLSADSFAAVVGWLGGKLEFPRRGARPAKARPIADG